MSRFPRDQKFVLGDRIETKRLEVQEICLRAYYGREKRAHLIEANMTLEITRHLVRLAGAEHASPSGGGFGFGKFSGDEQ